MSSQENSFWHNAWQQQPTQPSQMMSQEEAASQFQFPFAPTGFPQEWREWQYQTQLPNYTPAFPPSVETLEHVWNEAWKAAMRHRRNRDETEETEESEQSVKSEDGESEESEKSDKSEKAEETHLFDLEFNHGTAMGP